VAEVTVEGTNSDGGLFEVASVSYRSENSTASRPRIGQDKPR
jgi:hypothetical protein